MADKTGHHLETSDCELLVNVWRRSLEGFIPIAVDCAHDGNLLFYSLQAPELFVQR
jgi:hypothetical protein